MIVLFFAVAASAGTFIRWQLWTNSRVRHIGTIVANITGAFLLGVLASSSADVQVVGGVAGLGAMTTFSTLVAELVALAERSPGRAVLYGTATFVGGVGAAWLGLQLS